MVEDFRRKKSGAIPEIVSEERVQRGQRVRAVRSLDATTKKRNEPEHRRVDTSNSEEVVDSGAAAGKKGHENPTKSVEGGGNLIRAVDGEEDEEDARSETIGKDIREDEEELSEINRAVLRLIEKVKWSLGRGIL